MADNPMPSAFEKKPAVEDRPSQLSSADEQLGREASFLHRKIFGWTISEGTRAAYVSANKVLLRERATTNPISLEVILKRSLDVEAVEFALRRKIPKNLLTVKLLILLFITEPRNRYFTTFVNEHDRPFRGFAILVFYTIRSLYKLIKGRFLIWIYDVV